MRTRAGSDGRYRNDRRSNDDKSSRQSSKPYRRGGILLIGFDDERPRTLSEKASDAWRAFKGDRKT